MRLLLFNICITLYTRLYNIRDSIVRNLCVCVLWPDHSEYQLFVSRSQYVYYNIDESIGTPFRENLNKNTIEIYSYR